MLPTLIPVTIKEIKGPFLLLCSVRYIFKVFDVSDKVFIRFLKQLKNGSRDNFFFTLNIFTILDFVEHIQLFLPSSETLPLLK